MNTAPGERDGAGTPFDPAVHQVRDGVARKSNAGLWIRKGRRTAKNGKGAAAKRPAQNPPATAEKPPATAPEPPSAPAEIPVARAADVLADWPEQTVDTPGDAPGTAAAEGEAPAPAEGEATAAAEGDGLSHVAPDAPAAAAPGGLTAEGLSHLAVSIFEAERRGRIDDKEWTLDADERADLAAGVQAVLVKHEINPELSPEANLALKVFAVHVKRATKPKTAAWIRGLWGSFVALFKGKPKPAVPPADPVAKKPEPTAATAAAPTEPAAPPRELTIAEQYPA